MPYGLTLFCRYTSQASRWACGGLWATHWACCLLRWLARRFFNFGGPGKKKANAPQALLQQQQSTAASLSQAAPQGSLVGRRRGSDRSLSGSAHELAVSGVRDKELNRAVSHSHSQSNLSDIPYRWVQA